MDPDGGATDSIRSRPAASEDAPPPHGIAAAAVSVAALSSFLFGYTICCTCSCLELIAVVFDWCGDGWSVDCVRSITLQGFVNAVVYLGAMVGAMVVGRAIGKFGGRRSLCISSLFFCIGASLCVEATNVGFLVAGRFISGIGLGLCGVITPLYIAEISPRERRGMYSGMHQVFISLGIFASIAFGLPQSPPPSGPMDPLLPLDVWYWRVILGVPFVPAIAQIMLFMLVVKVDPPQYMISVGRTVDAQKYLYRIYGLESKGANTKTGAHTRVDLQLQEMVEATATAQALPPIKIRQVFFDPFLRCALFLGFALAGFQQLCGINALMSYSNSLFQEAGVDPAYLTTASTSMAAANVVVSVLSSQVSDRWGRRSLLLGGSVIQTVSLAILSRAMAMEASSVAIIFFSLYVISFSAGIGSVTWLYLSEIYPLEIRGSALGACGVVNWLCSFGVVFFTKFLRLSDAINIFGAICTAGVILIYLWVVETKGCNMDDSPLTPRSRRHSSPLLTPPSTPTHGTAASLRASLLDKNVRKHASPARSSAC